MINIKETIERMANGMVSLPSSELQNEMPVKDADVATGIVDAEYVCCIQETTLACSTAVPSFSTEDADNETHLQDDGIITIEETKIVASCEMNADKCKKWKFILFPPLRDLQRYCRIKKAFCYPAKTAYEKAKEDAC